MTAFCESCFRPTRSSSRAARLEERSARRSCGPAEYGLPLVVGPPLQPEGTPTPGPDPRGNTSHRPMPAHLWSSTRQPRRRRATAPVWAQCTGLSTLNTHPFPTVARRAQRLGNHCAQRLDRTHNILWFAPRPATRYVRTAAAPRSMCTARNACNALKLPEGCAAGIPDTAAIPNQSLSATGAVDAFRPVTSRQSTLPAKPDLWATLGIIRECVWSCGVG